MANKSHTSVPAPRDSSTSAVKKDPLIDLLAGFTAGCATTLAVHPLDLLKVRLQIDNKGPSQINGHHLINVVREIRSDDGLSAFYRGLAPNLVGNAVSWGAYFYFYETIKASLGRSPAKDSLGSMGYFASAGLAGTLTALLSNPIWVVKTRMLSTSAKRQGAYTGIFNGLWQLARYEGFRGYFRGILPSLVSVGNGAIQLMVYENLKILAAPDGTPLSTSWYIACSMLSKTAASLAMYPLQVVRSRLQRYDADNVYASMRDVIRQTVVTEGLSGLYKGLVLNLVRVLPATCVTFVVYEHTRNILHSGL
ncbi:mitochondrial carrier domain-containing protein [Dipodascopsis tothii]|uniref:mitochondrial carrier domain-containing protein n=1 Tax=Dipodascopsis tothii TaxID=44089 RepID=UPI0034CE1FE1